MHEYDSVTRNNGTSLIPSRSLSLNNNLLKFKEVPHKKLGAVVYTVKPGDTLWGISQLYLGTGKNYNEIQSIQEGLEIKIIERDVKCTSNKALGFDLV